MRLSAAEAGPQRNTIRAAHPGRAGSSASVAAANGRRATNASATAGRSVGGADIEGTFWRYLTVSTPAVGSKGSRPRPSAEQQAHRDRREQSGGRGGGGAVL